MATAVKYQLSGSELVTERVRRLKAQLLSGSVHVSAERVRHLLDVYRSHSTDTPVVKNALVLDRVLTNMTIFIDENPLVGTTTRFPVGCLPFPEHAAAWMPDEIDGELRTALGRVMVSDEDKDLIKEAAEFFRDQCLQAKYFEAWRDVHPDIDLTPIAKAGLMGIPGSAFVVMGVHNHAKVLNTGFDGLIRQAEEGLSKLSVSDQESWRKRHFLKAVIITLKAVIKFAGRYADLAREMAQSENDPARRLELERIAATCERVPAKPPRSFYDALQFLWFITLVPWIENEKGACSLGRFSQYMYPFYKKDKEEGRITAEEAIELIELFNLKEMQMCVVFQPMHMARMRQATGGQNINIGGLTADGRDATNEVDYLVLEAQRRVRTIQPTVSLLYHDQLSEDFLYKCIDLVKTGVGQPPFYNNEVAIRRMLDHPGMTIEEARSVCIFGCVEAAMPSTRYLGLGMFNIAKLVELALNNGTDPMSGLAIGPKTGDATEFRSYEELHEAVRKQAEYFMKIANELTRICHNVAADLMPRPFNSALVDGCIERGLDGWIGGAKYNQGGAIFITGIDLANSLAAIKRVVFELKALTMRELLDALRVDFEGHEDARDLLMRAPKFGNDDEFVDLIAKDWYRILWELHQAAGPYPTAESMLKPDAYSVAAHFSFGRMTGALPSGRKAGTPLTDASVSPSPGTDRQGPTAMLRSAAQAIDTVDWASNHLNMKLHPMALDDREGAKNLLALVKTYMDLGGWHVQFNYVSEETLRDAQAHPEQYRDLVVRVAGFSAFFVLLDKEVQEEIIKRTVVTRC